MLTVDVNTRVFNTRLGHVYVPSMLVSLRVNDSIPLW